MEAGEQGLALLLSHRSSPTHPPLPFCLSLFHFICLYFCCFTLSASNMHTVHTNANLIQYDTYLSNMILFSKCRFLNNYRSGYFPCASGCLILLVVIAQRYCCHLLLYHLFQNNVFYCFYVVFSSSSPQIQDLDSQSIPQLNSLVVYFSTLCFPPIVHSSGKTLA